MNWDENMQKLRPSEKGFALIEVLVSVALVGVLSLAYLGAQSAGFGAISISSQHAVAQKIAAFRMANTTNGVIQGNVPYDHGVPPSYAGASCQNVNCGSDLYHKIDLGPGQYLDCTGYYSSMTAARSDGTPLTGPSDSATIQKITVQVWHGGDVSHGGKLVETLSDYKVDRN